MMQKVQLFWNKGIYSISQKSKLGLEVGGGDVKVHVLDGGKSEVLKSGSEFLIKGFEK